jgi:hypothetical protein
MTVLTRSALSLELFLSLSALGGGLALILGPRGEFIPLDLLKGSDYEAYLIPGLVLFVVLGLGSLAAFWMTWQGHRQAPLATIATGFTLLIWMGVEIFTVGYSNRPSLQLIYIALGVSLVGIGIALNRTSMTRKNQSR